MSLNPTTHGDLLFFLSDANKMLTNFKHLPIIGAHANATWSVSTGGLGRCLGWSPWCCFAHIYGNAYPNDNINGHSVNYNKQATMFAPV
jgi:hypothetical protein